MDRRGPAVTARDWCAAVFIVVATAYLAGHVAAWGFA